MVRQSLPAHGAIRLPWGNESTVLPLIAAEDVARVATGLLTGPQPEAGSFHRLIGTTISLKEIVATFARVTGRNVHYEEISDEQWRRDVAVARLQSTRHRASLLAVARDPRCCDRSERSALRGHRGDRKHRRRETEDVRGLRARGPERAACEVGLSRE